MTRGVYGRYGRYGGYGGRPHYGRNFYQRPHFRGRGYSYPPSWWNAGRVYPQYNYTYPYYDPYPYDPYPYDDLYY